MVGINLEGVDDISSFDLDLSLLNSLLKRNCYQNKEISAPSTEAAILDE